jgi:hypothetical protein
VGEGTSPARPAVLAAREALLASRQGLDDELVLLEASARAAVDIPAKVKKHPVKAAGIAAGAGFIAVGGPRRLFRRAKRAVMGPEEPLPKHLLPKEIESSLKKLGTDGDRVRGLVEREFARYLDDKAEERKGRDLNAVIATLLLAAGRPVINRYGKQIVEQVLTTDPKTLEQQLAKVRARRAASGIEGERPA